MFFDDLDQISEIALKKNTSVFVVPTDFSPKYKNAILLQPVEKKTITIEQVRNIITKLGKKQTNDQLIVVDRVELLNDEAANAFLKNLEEPQEKVHFVLLTSEISAVMPTILSRAAIYFYRKLENFDEISADEKVKNMAKQLLVVKKADLSDFVNELTSKNDRKFVLEVINTDIQMLYKSYFLTKKPIFLQKLENFLKISENLQKNGHLKLQIIANLC